MKAIKKEFQITPENADMFRVAFNKGKAIVLEYNGDYKDGNIEFYSLERTADNSLERIKVGGMHFGNAMYQTAWLTTIWVYQSDKTSNQQDYRGFGIAAYGLKFFEEVLYSKGQRSIDGDYMDNGGTAWDLYKKNGYVVFDGTVGKGVDEDVISEIKNNTTLMDGVKLYLPLAEWKLNPPKPKVETPYGGWFN